MSKRGEKKTLTVVKLSNAMPGFGHATTDAPSFTSPSECRLKSEVRRWASEVWKLELGASANLD